MTKVVLLGAAAGLGYYLYTNPQLLDKFKKLINNDGLFNQFQNLMRNDGTVEIPVYEPEDGVCPEGYVISEDGTQCISVSGNVCDEGYTLSMDGLRCEPEGGQCEEGFVISADGKECLSTENPCGDGFKLNDAKTECVYDGNPCGDDCYKINDATQQCEKIPGCGTATGAEWGDILLYTGESIVAGIIYDKVGKEVGDALQRRAAQVAQRQLAKETAEASAKKLAEAAAKQMQKEAAALAAKKAVQEQATKAIQKVAQKKAAEALGKKTAGIVAKQAAKEVATVAGKKLAAKVASMVAKIGALSSTGIGALLTPLSLVALSLSVGLAASGTSFEKDSPDDWEWNDLPEGARVAIEAIPGVGDIISIMMNFIAFKSGCPTGLEDQNGLCYEPAKPGWNCEAFLCTPTAATYGFNPLSETNLHMTKRILMDTGTIPNRCPEGMVHGSESTDAAPGFCYNMPDYGPYGGTVVMGTAWQNCPPGSTDTGVRCEDFYGGGVGTIPNKRGCGDYNITNCRDDGTSLWSDWRCNTYCNSSSRDALGNCWAWDLKTDCGGEGKIVKALWERSYCPDGKEMIDGLCYNGCSEGYRREGLLCTRSFTKRSDVLSPNGNLCPDGKVDIAGLCYTSDANMPQGYRRKVIGTLDQDCPADKEEWKGYAMFYPTQDIGVSCQKASYTRTPFPKFSIYGMRKREPPPDPPDEPLPGLCSTLPPTPEGKAPTTLCRVSNIPEGYEMTPDGLNFFKKCRDGFSFKLETKECQFIDANGETEVYPNTEGFAEVEYSMV